MAAAGHGLDTQGLSNPTQAALRPPTPGQTLPGARRGQAPRTATLSSAQDLSSAPWEHAAAPSPGTLTAGDAHGAAIATALPADPQSISNMAWADAPAVLTGTLSAGKPRLGMPSRPGRLILQDMHIALRLLAKAVAHGWASTIASPQTAVPLRSDFASQVVSNLGWCVSRLQHIGLHFVGSLRVQAVLEHSSMYQQELANTPWALATTVLLGLYLLAKV